MNVDEKLVASIVQKVLSKVDIGSAEPNCAAAGGDCIPTPSGPP